MLKLEAISAFYGHIQALKNVSLSVGKGEIVALIGANGAGKSTTLSVISGVVPSQRGSVWWQGKDLSRLAPHEIVREGIVQVPEGRAILTKLTVRENLELGAFSRKDRGSVYADLKAVYDRFPILYERAEQPAGMLSGGEQQMLAIGRALLARPKLLLLDEPSMGLAPLVVQEIFRIIVEINREGTAVLLVEQNARAALGISSRGYVLETGRVVLEDSAENLLHNPKVIKAYLGA